MTKREQQQQRIISTAFRVWGASRFTSMSLTTLAEELALTKPALYRYFQNKDELMLAMRDRCAEDYIRFSALLVEQPSEMQLEELVLGFAELMNLFFAEQAEYAPFLITQLIGPEGFTRKDLSALIGAQYEALQRHIHGRYPEADTDLSETAAVFVMFTAVFWAMVTFIDENLMPRKLYLLDAATLEASISRSYRVCMLGLLRGGSARLPHFEDVEKVCRLGPDCRLEPDRILSAIAELVGEVGLFEATIERIAEKVGMSKSSLYFYFKNKDEMLVKMARRLRMHFFDVLLGRMEQFTSIEDRMYAFLVVTAAYMLHNPELLTVTHWFRAQNLDIEMDSASRERAVQGFAFLQTALGEGKLRAGEDELVAVVSYLNLFVMHDASFFRTDIRTEEELHRHVRSIYKLSMGGLSAAADKEGELS